MAENNRASDMAVEREVAAFLDKNLYARNSIFKNYKRTDSLDDQISGSDLVLSDSDGLLDNVVVDEKVAARYANTGLETFALELSFIARNGSLMEGWLTDKSKRTEFYLLGWITSADIPYDGVKRRWKTELINRDNIKELQWVLVSRRRIMEFLESRGWTPSRLAAQDARIRQNGGVKTMDFINGIAFRYSDRYVEKPINILLKKATFMELAICHGIATPTDDACVQDGESLESVVKEAAAAAEEAPKAVSNDAVQEDGSKIVLRSRIVNDKFTEYLFSNYDIQNKEETVSEIPLPTNEDLELVKASNWNIFLVCGKSGSGKSTIIRRLGYDGSEPSYDYDKAVISQFPNLGEKEACDLLSSMGLSSVPTWLRKPNEISNGERARLDIAKAIYDSDGGTVYLDEFTSVVNRSSAKSMSYALQRYARKKGLKLVIASCHMDVIEWLQPDYVFNLEHMDENTHVDVERMVYTDDTDYNVNQTVRQADILTEAMPIN